jgi:hypothetical protein
MSERVRKNPTDETIKGRPMKTFILCVADAIYAIVTQNVF